MKSVNSIEHNNTNKLEQYDVTCKPLNHYVPQIELIENLRYQSYTEEDRLAYVAKGKEIIDNYHVLDHLGMDDKLFTHVHGILQSA